jgi:alpha-glucosidase (family GH31 glycosyl hydrolase)
MPEPAVYMRWFQFACFSPIWRSHGKTTRDPWSYGDAAVTNYKFLAWTRENILNYTYTAAVIAHETGVPIMRSMPVSFPNEPPLAAVRDQYMFGDDLLIAPVLSDETSRTIVFPAGAWTSLWDGKTVRGPAQLKVSAPLDTIPVYLRSGAVVPVDLSPELKFGQSMSAARVRALVVTMPKGNQSAPLVNLSGQKVEVTVRSQSHSCSWKVQNFPELDYLLVYGVSHAAKVKMGDHQLPQLAAVDYQTMQAGWQADTAGNRLIIRVAKSQPQNLTAGTIEIEL